MQHVLVAKDTIYCTPCTYRLWRNATRSVRECSYSTRTYMRDSYELLSVLIRCRFLLNRYLIWLYMLVPRLLRLYTRFLKDFLKRRNSSLKILGNIEGGNKLMILSTVFHNFVKKMKFWKKIELDYTRLLGKHIQKKNFM